MDKTFVYVGCDGNDMFINLHQIVTATVVGDDLHISLGDGSMFIATGDAVSGLIDMLAEMAVSVDGKSVFQVPATERAKMSRLTLIRGGDESAEKSEKKTPLSEE